MIIVTNHTTTRMFPLGPFALRPTHTASFPTPCRTI